MKIKLLTIISFFLLTSAWAAPETPEKKRAYSLRKLSAEPVIDGSLSDSCWNEIRPTGDFSKHVYGRPSLVPKEQTSFKLGHLHGVVYAAITCETDDVDALRKTAAGKDAHIFSDDSVEIFVGDAAAGVYYQLGISVTGATYDSKGVDKSWNGNWKCATSIGKDAWYCEVALPLAAFDGIETRDEPLIRMNVCRNNQKYSESTMWSETRSGFQNPDGFGLIIFIPFKDYLEKSYVKALDDKMAEIAKEYKELIEKNQSKREKVSEVADEIGKLKARLTGAKEQTEEQFLMLKNSLESALVKAKQLSADLGFTSLFGQ